MNYQSVYELLSSRFGPQGWWPITDLQKERAVYDPDFSTRKRSKDEQFEVKMGAILTQNTNWKNVVKAIINLKKANLFSKEKIKKANVEEIAELIRSSGYFNQKAKKMKILVSSREEKDRDYLLSLWGVGEETADSILLYAYGSPFFVIDAYTKRIITRLENKFFPKYSDYQQHITSTLPKDAIIYNELHALFVYLGKIHCSKKTPRCENCPLNRICFYNQRKI